ncbi:MAG: DUF1598 domain-containing protein [Deltaproteobacteria bacterium]|nr:DUF1598 domain-containing protein [Deltaproteobacteria bacterium]
MGFRITRGSGMVKKSLIILIFSFCFLHNYICTAETQKVYKGRAVSLKILQEKVKECMENGTCSDKVLHLSGITKVVGYTIDEKNHDLILIGKVDPNLPPLYLEDFIIALRNAWMKYAKIKDNVRVYEYPGCSIDLRDEVAQQLQQLSKNSNEWTKDIEDKLNEYAGTVDYSKGNVESHEKQLKFYSNELEKYKSLLDELQERNQTPAIQEQIKEIYAEYQQLYTEYQEEYRVYQQVVQEFNQKNKTYKSIYDVYKSGNNDVVDYWCKICPQPQDVRVLGIPFHARFSKVMVEADYYMKRLVNGSAELDIDGFQSLTEMYEEKKVISNNVEMNRFWFFPEENSYVEDKGIVIISKSEVMLGTEKEYLSKKNKIKGKGRPDPVAKDFAENFSANYTEIAERKHIYKELEALFRFVSLLKVIKFKDAFSASGLQLDYFMHKFPIQETHVDTTLKGLYYIGEHGYTHMTCGGVSIEIEPKKELFIWDTTGELQRLREIILTARPSLSSPFWDFPRRRKEKNIRNIRSSPLIFIKLHGINLNGRWEFEVDDKYYNLNDDELQEYVEAKQGSGRRNFIITNVRKIGNEDKFKDAYKRGGDSGRFLRKLNQYNANAVIASNRDLAYKKLENEYPMLIKTGKPNLVVLDGLPGKRFDKIRNELDNYSKTGITIKDINDLDYVVEKDNLVVIVAPFTSELLKNIIEKSRNGFFKGKMVALVVCGQTKNNDNQKKYLKAIDVINKNGGRGVYSFEDTIWETECTLLFKNLLEIIDKEIKSNRKSEMRMQEAFDKAIEKTREVNLIENKRLDVKRIKKHKIFVAKFTYLEKEN